METVCIWWFAVHFVFCLFYHVVPCVWITICILTFVFQLSHQKCHPPVVTVPVSFYIQWTWELGTPRELWKTVLNSEVALFLRFISLYWINIGTGVAVLNSQVVPLSQVVLNTGLTVNSLIGCILSLHEVTTWTNPCESEWKQY